MDKSKNGLILKQKLFSNTSFQFAIRSSMKVGQCISYFPIELGSGNGTHQLEFRWFYWRTGYCLITFILYFIELVCCTAMAFKVGFNYLNIVKFAGNLSTLVQFILFFKLAYHWPTFSKKWSEVDVSMKNYKVPTNLRLKLNFLTTLFMLLGSVEAVLLYGYRFKHSFHNQTNISSAFEEHCMQNFPHIFHFVRYSFWMGLVVQKFLNTAFANVFVVVIATAVTYRLGQVSERIKTLSRMKVHNKTQWNVVRKDYNRLTKLCQTVNSRIWAIIFVSLSYNLYFVVRQLFFMVQRKDEIMQIIHYYFSFGILFVRMTVMCIFGGAVYEEWKDIGLILNSVATSAYNQEVERLTYQVHSCELSLSANNFFKLSRGLILEIAGAVVTYALVLIQYYQNVTY